VRPQGTTSVTRRQRTLTTVTITAGAIATATAAACLSVPSLAGTSSAQASGALVPASGPVRMAGGPSHPAGAGAGRAVDGNSPTPAFRAGTPVPASWPHSAPMAQSPGHLPTGVKQSLPSANWAGYEDTGTGAQFTEVAGSWVVPNLNQNVYGDSSTWVGIDGIKSHGDLIQAGTDQSWSAGGGLYYAWYELLPQDSVELGIVFPGDHITAEINESQPGKWVISVGDLTQHTSWTLPVSYTAAGTSAEWVEEAPTLSSSNSIETLADFGTVQFSNLTVAGPGTASATSSPIYMVNHSDQIIAYPTQYDPSTDSFNVIYGTLSSPPSGGQVGPPIAPTTTSGSPTSTTASPTAPLSGQGLWLVGKDGGIFALGNAQFHGSTGNIALQRPVTGMAPTADHRGYWMVSSDGGVFAFGDAAYAGSVPASGIGPVGSHAPHHLVAPIVAIVPTENGKGYLMVGKDGGVFAFGNAHFAGSCASIGGCPAPVVTVVPDATGNGYWMLLTNCDMVAFGDAPKITDTNCQSFAHANKLTATSAAATPSGKGYWVLLSNGTVFPEGNAMALGPGPDAKAASASDPAVAIVPTSDGRGAWVVDANGAVDAFGDAPQLSGVAGKALTAPIIGAAGW
jgi:Peptidase A4 family